MRKELLICGLILGLLLFGCIMPEEEKHFMHGWLQENPSEIKVYFEIFDENNQTIEFMNNGITAHIELWTLIPDGDFYYFDRDRLVFSSTETISNWQAVHPDYGQGIAIPYSAIDVTEEDADVGRLILTITNGNGQTEGVYQDEVRLRP